jgi:predicted methyltransferase
MLGLKDGHPRVTSQGEHGEVTTQYDQSYNSPNVAAISKLRLLDVKGDIQDD